MHTGAALRVHANERFRLTGKRDLTDLRYAAVARELRDERGKLIYNLMQVNKVFVLLAGFAACVVLLTLCVSFYFFPMLAMVDLPLGALLKNSMALVFGNIGKTLLALLLFALLIGLGVGLLPYSFIFAALIMFSFVASITTYLTYPAIEARVMRREEGHAAGELYQTLPQQEQPEVQLRSAGLDELRFEDDETEENAEN